MRKIKIIHHDMAAAEEYGVNIMDQISYSCDEGSISGGSVELPVRPRRKFTSFLDGTMRLYRVGYATHTGTPLYIAVIATAVLIRGKDRRLRKAPQSRYVYVLLFPFESYKNHIYQQVQSGQLKEEFYRETQEWVRDIRADLRSYVRRNQADLFEETEINPGTMRDVFDKNGTWIISDISYKGLISGREGRRKPLITDSELYNPNRVHEVARTRARYLMGLLEFYSAITHLEANPGSYIMIDGLFYPYKRVGALFGITKDEYKEKMKNVVGFIKHPREIPQNIIQRVATLREGKYFSWTGGHSPSEEDKTQPPIPSDPKSEEKYGFAVLRFRTKPGVFVPSPVGIIKLQTSPQEDIRETIEAVLYERNPVPTDRRRLYNESYPIEEAERVAKALLPSESKIRGFVLSIL